MSLPENKLCSFYLFYRKRISILFLISLVINSNAFCANDSLKVDAFGKLFFDKTTSQFFFMYEEKEEILFLPIKVSNKNEYKKYQNLHEKFVKLTGNLVWEKQSEIESSRNNLKLQIDQLHEFKLSDLTIRYNYSPDQISGPLLTEKKKHFKGQISIPLSSKTTNTILAGGGIVMGAIVGPIALVPVGFFALINFFSE